MVDQTGSPTPAAEPAEVQRSLGATARGREFLAAQRETLANRVAAMPGAWMGIPGWARWTRITSRLRHKDLGELERQRENR